MLIAAPTGSGKTLAAFLAVIDELVRESLAAGPLADETRVVYVSPLKALSNDINRNLEAPLAGIGAELRELGLPEAGIRTFVRTGDTPQHERRQSVKRPPHIVVTTPESLYILMGSESGRQMLATTRTVIVDEIHAIAGTKRGAHLAVTLERLESLAGRKLTRVGLSATQKTHRRRRALPRRHAQSQSRRYGRLHHHRRRPRARCATCSSKSPPRRWKR